MLDEKLTNIRIVLPVEKSVTRLQDRNGFGNAVLCPVCGSGNMKVNKVRTALGNEREGTAWAGRGHAYFVGMVCDEGHVWEIRFGTHRGQVFAATEVVRCSDEERTKLTKPPGRKNVKRLVEKKALFDF